jgi:hypothetical protein
MKTLFTKTILLIAFVAIAFQAGAQVPEQFNYQLAVRDAQGNVYASQQLSFRVSIMQGSTILYRETHSTQTNAYGLVNLMIGDGTPTQGSMAAIDWGGEAKSLKVEFDPTGGSSYTDLATTPLLSVPYALYAKHSEEPGPAGPEGPIGPQGPQGPMPPIGGVHAQVQFNNNGVFSGSEDFIYMPTDKRVGIGLSGAGPVAPLHAQGSVLGVVGIATAESGSADGGYFTSRSTSGVGVTGVSKATGVRGTASATSGDAYGGHFSTSSNEGKGVAGFSSATSGHTYGGYFQSSSTSGRGIYATSPNIAIQTIASGNSGANYGGHFTTSSTEGTGIYTHATASSGISYGIRAYTSSSQGFSGYFAGGKFYISGNTGIGTNSPEAGLHLKGAGFPNTFMYLQSDLGQDAGFRIYEGTNVKWSIFNQSSSGGLNIYNTVGTTAIFAKQSNAFVGIGNTAPTQALDVNGNARFRAIGSGPYAGVVNRTSDGTLTTTTSDIRLKENIHTLQGGLNKVLQLRGVTFTWINNPENGQRIGFIAQEFEKVLPELVFTNEVDDYKGINYAEVSAVLVEAVKELKAENDEIRAHLERLEKALEKLMNDD